MVSINPSSEPKLLWVLSKKAMLMAMVIMAFNVTPVWGQSSVSSRAANEPWAFIEKENLITEPTYFISSNIEGELRKKLMVKATGMLANPSVCFAVSDGDNTLKSIDRASGTPITDIGPTSGAADIEALVMNMSGDTVFAANANIFGWLNTSTGVFNSIGNFGTGTVGTTSITFSDVDGMSIDPRTGKFYGAHRRSGQNDVLFQFDRFTGSYVPDAFGSGVDYLVIDSLVSGGNTLRDVDDIAIDPSDGTMYAVINAGSNDRLITIDLSDGSVADVGRFTYSGSGVNDIEGLDFFNDGTLYATTGTGGTATTRNSFYTVNISNGVMSLVGNFTSGSDYEGSGCLTGGSNVMSGQVFLDNNSDTLNNAGDGGQAGVEIQLFIDTNNDGQVDTGDVLIQTVTSDANGDYSFEVGIDGNFVLQLDTTTMPPGASMTTDIVEEVDFVNWSNTNSDNDFGMHYADLEILKTINNSSLGVGDDAIFTLIVTNEGPSIATGILVQDSLTAGFSYVSDDGGGSYNSSSGVWTVPDLEAGETATLQVVATITQSGALTNSAEIIASDLGDPDSEPGDGSDEDDDSSVSTNSPADLSLSKSVDQSSVEIGGQVVFSLTISNGGAGQADTVQVKDVLPSGFNYQSDDSGGDYDATTGIWEVGLLANGTSASIQITATASQLGSFTNTAEVSYSSAADPDSTPDNGVATEDDQDNVSVTVNCAAAAGENILKGYVFFDENQDTLFAGSDVGWPDVKVNIYQDNNQDGAVDGGDTLVDTDTTDANGAFESSISLPLLATQNFQVGVATGADDVEEEGNGNMYNNSSDLEMVDDNGDIQIIGIRFQNVNIPAGAQITDARIEFYADGNHSTSTSLTITAQDTSNAPAFPTADFSLSNYDTTNAMVAWNSIPNWTDNNTYQTPDLSTIVQEITQKSGWSSGNSMSFIIKGDSGRRRAESFNGSGGPEPQLIIDYALPDTPAYYVVEIVTTDLPTGATMTTDNVEATSFSGIGETTCGMDFGFSLPVDLSLTKLANDLAPNVGDTVIFTLTVLNDGTSNATSVSVVDSLPSGLTYVSDDSGGDYNSTNGTWTVGTVTAGGSESIQISAEVTASGSIKNMAQVSAANQTEGDSTPNNDDGDQSEDDEDAVTLVVPAADLRISKTVNSAFASIGDTVTYTITVNNDGPDAANSVVVSDQLPSGLTYLSDNGGGDYNSGNGNWTIGIIYSGGLKSLSIQAIVQSAGTWTNAAEVSTSPVYDPDSTPGNNDLAEDDRDSTCTAIPMIHCPGTADAIAARAGLNNYQWYRNGAAISGANSQIYIVDTIFIATDTFTWTADIPSGGSVQSDCPYLFIKVTLTVTSGSNSPVCEGSTINLTESGGSAVSWSWAGPNSFSSTQQNPSISNAIAANSGNYSVTITDSNGCTAESGTISVNVSLQVNAGTALANDTLCLNGSGLSLINLFSKYSGEDSGGTWTAIAGTPGSNFNASAGTLNPNGLPEDTYTFRYTVAGNSPCPDDSEDWTLIIERCCPPNICLPVTTTRNN